MSNFGFVQATLPAVAGDAARAESYLHSDPRSACIYARRSIELLVAQLYDVLALNAPYVNDLSARINDAAFKRATGNGINAKLNLIRKLGNAAVHDKTPIQAQSALTALRELHHVLIWASFHHSPHPEQVPTKTAFDPQQAEKAAPLTRAEVVQLAEKFRAQDEAHAQALEAKDSEIAALRQEVKDAQAANTRPDEHDYSEAETRDEFIDVLLNEAGWPLTDARDREYRVTGMPGPPTTSGEGFVDYVLWGADGLPLAVVEAKRTTASAAIGQQQAKLYADCLETQFGRRPVIFYTNGYEHWLWDDASGYPPRAVQGFLTRDELELMIQRRRTRLPLSNAGVNTEVAGRPYQVRAIKAVGATLDAHGREALLVMATGSGKTRTVVALVEQLMAANWVKRVLFLADRTALVKQAVNTFKTHLPSATTVNLVTEKTGNAGKITEGRVYASTYPTMMNLIDSKRFGPGHFDLIVIDEAHRSVYAKYGAIFEHFDSLLVGLTATPKDEVDHNTYRLFHLEDGVPTDAYSLDEAVAEGYLVPPKGVAVDTKFLREGIRYDDLSADEQDQWDTLDWGEEGPPDEVGTEELNRFLFNADTVDKVLAQLMRDGHKVAGGDRIGKTIIFAKNQEHARFIQERFDIGWPAYAGEWARVITHATPYAQSLIDDFSQADKAPHIAISVDMLDTGIDVPEVLNLVFFKVVRSKSKFWQMIGRGTRLCPGIFGPGPAEVADKQDFMVFDYCGNLAYFSQDPPGTQGSTQKSLTQRIFETRLGLVAAGVEGDLRATITATLREVVAGMSMDNFLVRPHRRMVEKYAAADAWASAPTLPADELEAVAALGGLPTSVRDDDEHAKRFDLLILTRQLADLQGDAGVAEKIRATVQRIAAVLLTKTTIPSVAQQALLLESVAGDEWWVDVSLPMLELVRLRLRGLLTFVDRETRAAVYTDFEDTLGDGVPVVLPGIVPGTDMTRFRAKATAFLREHLDHVALQRLHRNRQLTPDDLIALEQMLRDCGAGDAELATVSEGGLGLFVRSLVGLDRAAAMEAFANYLDEGRFTVDQVRFVHLIIDELTSNGAVEATRLFESPYTDHAPTGPDFFFPAADVSAIVEILHDVRQRALA